MRILPYGKQQISKADIQAVSRVLSSEFLTQGPVIAQFEEALAKYVGSKFCVVVNSGTAALHAAYFACGIEAGDEVITSPLTFAATSNAALYLGATTTFVDIDPVHGNISTSEVAKKISKKTKCVVPIHYAGLPADVAALAAVKKEFPKLKIVEDACHALGAVYKGKRVGSCQYSDAAAFSFHPVKHITTGEGGAVCTNDPKIYQKLLQFRTHGITKDVSLFEQENEGDWYHEMQLLGFNYRMCDIQAALGLSQLQRIEKFIQKRRQIAKWYASLFAGNEYFEIPTDTLDATHAYHLYPIVLKPNYRQFRKKLFNEFKKNGLGVQVHYIPVYLHPYYRQLGYKPGLCSKAEMWYQGEISLPMFVDMKKSDVFYIAKVVETACSNL